MDNPTKEDIRKHKVKTLETLNDSDSYIIMTKEAFSLAGSHDNLVSIVASCMYQEKELMRIFTQAAIMVAMENKKINGSRR